MIRKKIAGIRRKGKAIDCTRSVSEKEVKEILQRFLRPPLPNNLMEFLRDFVDLQSLRLEKSHKCNRIYARIKDKTISILIILNHNNIVLIFYDVPIGEIPASGRNSKSNKIATVSAGPPKIKSDPYKISVSVHKKISGPPELSSWFTNLIDKLVLILMASGLSLDISEQ